MRDCRDTRIVDPTEYFKVIDISYNYRGELSIFHTVIYRIFKFVIWKVAWMWNVSRFFFLFWQVRGNLFQRVENCRMNLVAFFRWCSMGRRLIPTTGSVRDKEKEGMRVERTRRKAWRVERVKWCRKMGDNMKGNWIWCTFSRWFAFYLRTLLESQFA